MVWQAHSTPDGQVYYYDDATGATSWSPPMDMQAAPPPPQYAQYAQYELQQPQYGQAQQQIDPAMVRVACNSPNLEMMPSTESGGGAGAEYGADAESPPWSLAALKRDD